MSLVVLVPLLSLGLYLIPIVLLRQRSYPRAQDYVVASEHTPPGVIANSSIAYALKMATFGPFFAFGASGDVWPPLIAAVCFALGLCAIFALRRPILAFLEDALGRDRSVTVHDFIARMHGNDARLRVVAANLTLLALAGLITAEAIGVASVLRPVLAGKDALAPGLAVGLLILAGLYTMMAGNSGVMRAAQSQLGLLYLGLIGAAALLLYLQTSALKQMPAYGTLAVVWAAVFCLVLIGYRRSRYVDTSPVRMTAAKSAGIGLFRRFEKVLNVCITTLAMLVVVIAGMEVSADGVAAALRESATALEAAPRLSGIGIAALIVLPLTYSFVDITNWQRIAAFEKSDVERAQRPAALKRLFRLYGAEAPLMWIFFCMFGAIAAIATATPGDTADVLPASLGKLYAQPNLVASLALAFLLIALLAMALNAVSAAFSAGLCTIRYDILPAVYSEPAASEAKAVDEPVARRRTVIWELVFGAVCVVAFLVADRYLRISFASSAFLALVFAICCAQLALAPLVLGPLIGATRGGVSGVPSGWALATVAIAAAAAAAAVVLYLATGSEPWLWAAVPACLASGFALFAVARLMSSASGP